MNPETINNWLIKAEHDLKIGKDELDTANPATDMVCFHMQQCAETYEQRRV
jgi:HEPN domain-containing protein